MTVLIRRPTLTASKKRSFALQIWSGRIKKKYMGQFQVLPGPVLSWPHVLAR